MTRLKAKKLSSLDEFNIAVEEVSTLSTSLRLHTAHRDKAIQEVQERFAEPIQDIKLQMDALLAQCDAYATEHRAELFEGTAKSARNEFATYGFRDGNPALKLLNKKHTWETVKAALKAHGHGDLVLIEEAVDKPGVKARLDDVALASVGLRITQDESFFINPHVEGAEPVAA